MRFSVFVCTFLALVAVAFASQKDEGRFLNSISFTVFTVIKSTTTTTSTLVSTITCTTSTATLSTCTAGRRRRGLFYSESEHNNRRGLFYNDDDESSEPQIVKRSNNPVDEVKEQKKPADNLIPLELESGFKLPDGAPVNRFLLAIGTATSTVYTVSSTTTSLTAVCSSTTGFPTCGSGK